MVRSSLDYGDDHDVVGQGDDEDIVGQGDDHEVVGQGEGNDHDVAGQWAVCAMENSARNSTRFSPS